MKYFIDRLIDEVKRKKSHICVGLDPHLDLLPRFLLDKARKGISTEKVSLGLAIWLFNQVIIDQIADLAVAVKPQIAFYELIGPPGMVALRETIKYAREKGLLVILDAKRNDIGSTAYAYARAYLEEEGLNEFISADSMTINPYLGFDGIEPFIKNEEKGAFALVRTSNPSAGNLQDLKLADGRRLYQKVGYLISTWGEKIIGEYGFSNLGAVVGATYPEELALLRQEMPHTYFLIPGFGAQGGRVEDIVYGFNDDGLGALINSARGIIFAYQQGNYEEKEFGAAARAAALEMRDKINKAL